MLSHARQRPWALHCPRTLFFRYVTRTARRGWYGRVAFSFPPWHAVARFSAASGIVHEKFESVRPRRTLVPNDAGLRWPQPEFPVVVSWWHDSPDPA
jgi:hypothetical protein